MKYTNGVIENKLKLNVSKRKSLVLTRRLKLEFINFTITWGKLELVESIQDIGINLF